MSYMGKVLEQLTEADLQGMIGMMGESRTLEFKEALPPRDDKKKVEFLADVTALANTAGGDIIFGMRETEGVASELPGLEGDMDVGATS